MTLKSMKGYGTFCMVDCSLENDKGKLAERSGRKADEPKAIVLRLSSCRKPLIYKGFR